MASSINVDQVLSEYGSFYEKNPANMKKLLGKLRQKSRTAQLVKPWVTENTKERLVSHGMSEVIQAFQRTFTSKGTHTFEPNEIQLYNLKIDFEDKPDKFKASWLGFMTGLPNDMERKNWPYTAYLLNELIRQANHDREAIAYGNGRYVAPSEGTAGAALNSMEGIVRLARAAVNNGGHQFLLSNDPGTTTGAFDAFEEMARDLPSDFDGERILFYCDPVLVKNYLTDKRNTLGTNVNYKEDTVIEFSDLYNDGTGWAIQPLPALRGSGICFATPYDNFVHARHIDGIPAFKVESDKRNLAVYTDWWEGFGFVHNEFVYLYEPNWSYSGSTSGTLV